MYTVGELKKTGPFWLKVNAVYTRVLGVISCLHLHTYTATIQDGDCHNLCECCTVTMNIQHKYIMFTGSASVRDHQAAAGCAGTVAVGLG